MSMKNYFEEFNRRYNQPRINSITVGFSGIDPTPKSSFILNENDTDSNNQGHDNPSGTSGSVNIGNNQYQVASNDEINTMLDDVF